MQVLDAGCGTGSITRGIAERVGSAGQVIGIDVSRSFIEQAKTNYSQYSNLSFECKSIFEFEPVEKFDLVTTARTLQWLSNPAAAIVKLKSWLKPGGIISILDYNHEKIEWRPAPPASMIFFYNQFLMWRKDAGMNNRMADDLSAMLLSAGFNSVTEEDAGELSSIDEVDFFETAGIWAKVAETRGQQMVQDGYVSEQDRLQAIQDYSGWLENEGQNMALYLKTVVGCNPIM
jgi:ubiquinone/menaquinone biosynthesis C-methylase UbiE